MSHTPGAPPGAGAPPLALLLRHSAIYSLVPILQRMIGFLLIPLFTYKLNPAQWGALQMTDLLVVAIMHAAGVNLLAGMVRFYFDEATERGRAEVITSTIAALSLGSALFASVALYFRDPLAALLFDLNDPALAGDALPRVLSIALSSLPLTLVSEAGFRYLQILQRSGTYTLLRSLKLLLELGLKIWMVVYLEWGVAGFVFSVLVGEFITSMLLSGTILVMLGARVSWARLRPMVIFSLPLIPVGVLQLGLHQVDRVMLRALGPTELAMSWVGIYGLGYQVGFLVQQMGMGSFMQIWQPALFAVKDARERELLQARVHTYAMVAVACSSGAIMLFGREIIAFLSGQPEYQAAERVLPWVTAGYVFYGLYALGQASLLADKRSLPLMWINAGALLVNVGLDIVLIPRLGYVGPAVATLLTFVLIAWMVRMACHKPGDMPLERLRVGLVLGAATLTLGVALALDAWASGAGAWILKSAALLLLLVFCWRVVLSREERRSALTRLPAMRFLT